MFLNNEFSKVKIEFSSAFSELFEPFRYKVFYGGRGAAKSWHFAIALILIASRKKIRVLCTREYQASIGESVHKLLAQTIERLNLEKYYIINEKKILCSNGSEFLFHGLYHDINKVKSLENINICWLEEGQSVSRKSWEVLIPTIRSEKSEIWVSFNPQLEEDDTYQRFVCNSPDNSLVKKVTYRDNPWFPEVLRQELESCKKTDYVSYLNIWEGECIKYTESQIFRNKYEVQDFITPDNVQFYYGADWGFSKDPTVLLRAFIRENILYVDYEAYGVNVDLDQTPALFDLVPQSRKYPIKADGARPETIHFMQKRGFIISAAAKWAGSVMDGIGILKSFSKIVIHSRCKHTINEAKHYSYKVNRNTNEILPLVEDRYNHCFDALRYALDTYIRGKNSMRFERK